MHRRRFLVTIFLAFFAAISAEAGVVINEVAWMGTQNSAQDEWIELYSDRGQSLEGWTLVTVDGGMTINLSGIANGYYLIERTDDTTVPDVRADLIAVFGSGLSNSGEVLMLKNADGSEIDSVDGSSDWAIGGNNTTKETLQRNASRWITAIATPRAENIHGSGNEQVVQQQNNSGENNQQSGSVLSNNANVLFTPSIPDSKFKARAGEDRTVLAGAEIGFEGSAEGFTDSSINKARFLWNFGDGYTADGQKVAHIFSYPGTYSVFLNIAFSGVSVSDSLKVTVIENPVVISEIKPGETGGWIEIRNNSPRKIDFSNFGIAIGSSKSFYFRGGTFIEPYAFITIGSNFFGLEIPRSGEVKIVYPNGEAAFFSVYRDLNLSVSESASFSDGKWLKSKATPGEKNEILRSLPNPAPPVQITKKPTADLQIFDKDKEIKSENLVALAADAGGKYFYKEYFWLFAGLAAGALAGLVFILTKRYLF